jgi:hypothetical protein
MMKFEAYSTNLGLFVKLGSSYTPIKGWEANSLKEMQEQVGVYLTSLMNEINLAVSECTACGGAGCIEVNKIKTNERSINV